MTQRQQRTRFLALPRNETVVFLVQSEQHFLNALESVPAVTETRVRCHVRPKLRFVFLLVLVPHLSQLFLPEDSVVSLVTHLFMVELVSNVSEEVHQPAGKPEELVVVGVGRDLESG